MEHAQLRQFVLYPGHLVKTVGLPPLPHEEADQLFQGHGRVVIQRADVVPLLPEQGEELIFHAGQAVYLFKQARPPPS